MDMEFELCFQHLFTMEFFFNITKQILFSLRSII